MKDEPIPTRVSVYWLAQCAGIHYQTARKRLDGYKPGKDGLYDRVRALARVYVGEGGEITYGEAQKRLSLVKAEKVKQDMRIAEETHLPEGALAQCALELTAHFRACCRAHQDKILSASSVDRVCDDMFLLAIKDLSPEEQLKAKRVRAAQWLEMVDKDIEYLRQQRARADHRSEWEAANAKVHAAYERTRTDNSAEALDELKKARAEADLVADKDPWIHFYTHYQSGQSMDDVSW